MTSTHLQTIRLALAVALVLLVITGCAAPRPSVLNFSVSTQLEADPAAVFDAAEGVLLNFGYRVEQRDRAVGILSTYPVQPTDQGEPPLRISRRRPLPTRQVAQVRLEQDAGGVLVFCKVAIQELSTAAYQMFAYESSGQDVPSETAIERGAATTEAQDAVWTTIRRHRQQEREILTAITEAVTDVSPGSGATKTP